MNKMNVPQITIGTAINQITSLIVNFTKSGMSIKDIPTVFLWGPPGVGKSEGVIEIAKNIESKLNKKVNVTDVRLLLYNPIDLRGIPVPNEDKTVAKWLKPEIFNLDASNDVINILFLDELSSAPISVQAAAYQLTLDRKIGEHKLPDNVYVIAAGNRKEDNSVVNSMPKALANRMLHFDILSDFLTWKKWAIENNINEKVIGFLQYKSEYLYDNHDNKDEMAFATPRSWKKVSDVLNKINSNIDEVKYLVSGLIGVGVTSEFRSFIKCYKFLPNVEDILSGKDVEVPNKPDVICALISALTLKVKVCIKNNIDFTNIIKYSRKLSKDFQTILHSNIADLAKQYDYNVFADNIFDDWASDLSENIAA